MIIISKDDYIKELQDKIDGMCKNNNDKDYEFYKRNYEEQKQRSALEHELLSNSLYDLALQFITFKKELVKNVKPSN